MKIALVHEFLTQFGGAERVLQVFHEMFPQAPVFTLVYDRKKTQGMYDNWDIRTSFLQSFPRGIQNYKFYLPLMTRAIESFDFQGYDVVLSDSSAFAKGVITKSPTRHISYCHTPTRYLWENLEDYVDSLPYPFLIKSMARPYLRYHLKKWDWQAAQRPDLFIANSNTVAKRIKKYYGREALVIYPPVDTQSFRPGVSEEKGEFFLTVSRLEPYKRIDLAVQAFNSLGLPLKIAGDGTSAPQLRSMVKGKNIELLGLVSDEQLKNLYQKARALVFPALEDSGIVVLESLASGTPVIGLNQGGTAEFVKHKKNGVLFERQTVDDVVAAVTKFQNLKMSRTEIRETAEPFDQKYFVQSIHEQIQQCVSG